MVGVLDLKLPSCEEVVDHVSLTNASLPVFVKREDHIHPSVSGNKWRKLKYNIQTYFDQGYHGILSFGGAYSNHLYALAYVCSKLNIPLICIVRGDGYDPSNVTLTFLHQNATVHYVDRENYRLKERSEFCKSLSTSNPNHLWIPEGGSSDEAERGLHEMCDEIDWHSYSHIYVGAGTGATAKAMMSYAHRHCIVETKICIVSSLKGAFMHSEFDEYGSRFDTDINFVVLDDYHFGGYAKMPKNLLEFSSQFIESTGIPIDMVYNAKCVFAMLDQINKGNHSCDDRLLWINTGGRRE